MTRCIHLILALTLVFSALGDLYDFAYYQLNKTFIAANFCINSNDAEMKCEGKCYLMSNLKDNRSADDNKPITFVDIESKWQIPITEIGFVNIKAYQLAAVNFIYRQLFVKKHVTEIFHPPQ